VRPLLSSQAPRRAARHRGDLLRRFRRARFRFFLPPGALRGRRLPACLPPDSGEKERNSVR
jgi:hypothetical protein